MKEQEDTVRSLYNSFLESWNNANAFHERPELSEQLTKEFAGNF